MRHLFIILSFLVLELTAYSQKDSVRGRQFEMTGSVTGKVHLAPPCGFIAWATVIAFKVVNITGMAYKNENIGIVVTCPAHTYDDNFFKKGQLYRIIFSDTNQADFGWTILNSSLLKTNQLSFLPFAISIKKTP